MFLAIVWLAEHFLKLHSYHCILFLSNGAMGTLVGGAVTRGKKVIVYEKGLCT